MAVFPTAAHLVSWAKWSPQVRQSAGKRKGSNSTGRGNPYLGAALGEAGISAGRTQSFLGARYRKLTRRMPRKKALVATGNSMLTIIHALLSDPAAVYTDLGADYYEQRMHARRQARNHVKSLERLGYKVTIETIDPATGEPSPRPADHCTKNPATLTRHRVLPRAQPRSIFGPAQSTIRSTHRVSRLLTGRGTISVTVTLDNAASTSRPPATAATTRPANGITIASSSVSPGCPEPTRSGRTQVPEAGHRDAGTLSPAPSPELAGSPPEPATGIADWQGL